jgi:hypothetical protein
LSIRGAVTKTTRRVSRHARYASERCEKGLSSAREADEERVDAFLQEDEIVKREVARAELLADRVEVEIEAVDGVDLGKPGAAHATLDGGAKPTVLLFVAQTGDHVGR